MNSIIINGYVKLLQRRRISLNDIPSEYTVDVKKYMDEGSKSSTKPGEHEDIDIINDKKMGAISIPDIRDYEIEVDSSDSKLISEFTISEDLIFSPEVFTIAPCNPEFTIFNIENIYGRLGTGLQVTLYEIKGDLKIKVWGTVNTFVSADPLFRLDLQITSDNYEDMSVSLFFVAK